MDKSTTYDFRLFIARNTQNSSEALINLNALCRAHLKDRHTIEIVDVLLQPERALAENIRMTPTLIKLSPLPGQRIVGTLRQTERVLLALGIDPSAT